MKAFARYQFPLLIWALFIFILSSFETLPHIETPIIAEDKLGHISVYFIFCWLSQRALFFQNKFPALKRWSLAGAFFLTCIYGYLDEVHQIFVPGRIYDYYDLLADAIGAVFFILLHFYLEKRKRRKLDAG